jgi:hypothetical protein
MLNTWYATFCKVISKELISCPETKKARSSFSSSPAIPPVMQAGIKNFWNMLDFALKIKPSRRSMPIQHSTSIVSNERFSIFS